MNTGATWGHCQIVGQGHSLGRSDWLEDLLQFLAMLPTLGLFTAWNRVKGKGAQNGSLHLISEMTGYHILPCAVGHATAFFSCCCCNKWPRSQWVALNNTNLFFYISGSEKSETVSLDCNQGVNRTSFPMETFRENPFSCLSSSWRLPVFLGSCPLPSSQPAITSLVFLMKPLLWLWLFCLPLPHLRTLIKKGERFIWSEENPEYRGCLLLHWAHLDNPGCSPHLQVNWSATFTPLAASNSLLLYNITTGPRH